MESRKKESATAVGTDERPVKKPSGLYNRRRNETKKERSETLDRRQPKTIRDRLEKEEEGVRIKKKKGGETGRRDVKSTRSQRPPAGSEAPRKVYAVNTDGKYSDASRTAIWYRNRRFVGRNPRLMNSLID
ncbi:hypothetical protein B296_00008650 [Ensete ventricosum]|uniref:Uncharacterized protein n=1 Tax=Ensete ventricosum TaxID=4639 RepID=A0A427A030_ENSVE|nr:hypothetical protein B296_00008650 [Ensete ventricosum]